MSPKLPLLILSVSALAACASQHSKPQSLADAVSSAADLHRINVEQSGERLDLSVADGTLSRENRAKLADFASAYLRLGHGDMVMSTPSGNANADAAAHLAQQARMTLVDQGVPYEAVAGSTYDASSTPDAPLVLSFTRYEAHAPDCRPLWEQDLAHQSDNQPWDSFGCATQANVAAMVEDPHDLIAPRDEAPRDGNRRAVVMDHYRQGQPTGATRSDDERVSISHAIQ
jgi:pilus assembly protein CpaD